MNDMLFLFCSLFLWSLPSLDCKAFGGFVCASPFYPPCLEWIPFQNASGWLKANKQTKNEIVSPKLVVIKMPMKWDMIFFYVLDWQKHFKEWPRCKEINGYVRFYNEQKLVTVYR